MSNQDILKNIYIKGGMIGRLEVTQREGAGYKWVGCLALLDKNGRWLYSSYWRTNHFRKAHKELIDGGWSCRDHRLNKIENQAKGDLEMINNMTELLERFEAKDLDQMNDRLLKYGEISISPVMLTTTRKVCYKIVPCIPGLRVMWRYLNGKWNAVNEYSPKEIREYASVDDNNLIIGSKTLEEIRKVNPEIKGDKITLEVIFHDRAGVVLSAEDYELESLTFPFTEKTLSKALDDAEEGYGFLLEEMEASCNPERYFCTDRR